MMNDFDQHLDSKRKNSLSIPKTSDKRREISRDAARQRRNNESDVFIKLQEVVPIVDEPKVSHVDRIALLRLAASYIRFRHIASKILTNDDDYDRKPDMSIALSDCFSESKIGELLNGFLLIVDSPGFIIYASASVSKFLGVTQTDLVGHNLSEFLKDEDVREMLDVISRCQENVQERTFLRMKSVLGARGRSLNLRSALFKTISFSVVKRYISMDNNICDLSEMSLSSSSTASSLVDNQTASIVELKTINIVDDQDENSGESMRTTPEMDIDSCNKDVMENACLKPSAMKTDENANVKRDENFNCGKRSRRKKQKSAVSDGQFYFFVGSPMNQCGNSVETYCSHVFVTRHSMDMKFSYCHEKLTEYIGYDVKTLTGLSFYSLVHPLDLRKLQEDFKQIYQKQQITTGLYRIMAEQGGYVWLSTEATIVTQGARSGRGQHIVCVHQVVSATTGKEILADIQKQINAPATRQRPFSDFDMPSSQNTIDEDNFNGNAMKKFSGDQKEVVDKYYAQGSLDMDKRGKYFPIGTNPEVLDDTSSLPIFELDDAFGINYEPWLFRDNGRQKSAQNSIVPAERLFSGSGASLADFTASAQLRNVDDAAAKAFSPPSVPIPNAVADEKCAHRPQPVSNAAVAESLTQQFGGGQYFSGANDAQFERIQCELGSFAPRMGAIQNDIDEASRTSVAHSRTNYERKSLVDQYRNGFRQLCSGSCRRRSEHEQLPQVPCWKMATPHFKERRVGVQYNCNEQSPNGNAKEMVEPIRFIDNVDAVQSASTNTSTGSTNSEVLPTDGVDSSCAQPSTDGGSMYTALSNANFLSTTNELNEKVDELTSLAPFVDTGELVNLDISAGELDIPLDFGDLCNLLSDIPAFSDYRSSSPSGSRKTMLGESGADDCCCLCTISADFCGCSSSEGNYSPNYNEPFDNYSPVRESDPLLICQEMTMDTFDPQNKSRLNCDTSATKNKEKSGQKCQMQQQKSSSVNDQWIYDFLLNENQSKVDVPVTSQSDCAAYPASSSSASNSVGDQQVGYVWGFDSPVRHDPGASISSLLFRDTCVANSNESHADQPKVEDSAVESSVDVIDSKTSIAKLQDDQTSAASGDKNSLNDSFGSTSSLFQEFGDLLYPPNYDLCDANNYLIADALLSSSDVKLADAATTNRDRKESESATTSLTNNFSTIDDLEMFFNSHDSMSNAVMNSDNNMWSLEAHFNQNAGIPYPLSAEQIQLSPVKNASNVVVDEAGHGYARLEEQSSSTDRYSFVPKPQAEYEIQSETSSKTFHPNVNVGQNDEYGKSVKTMSHGVKAYASPSPYAAQKQFSSPAVPSSSAAAPFSGYQQLQARFAPGFNITASLQNGSGVGRSMANLTSSSNPIVRGISASYTNVYSSMNGPNRSSTMSMGRKRPINPIKVREVKRPYSVAPYQSQSTSFSSGFGFNVSGKNAVPPGISCYPPTSSVYSNAVPTQVSRQFTPPGIRTITGNAGTSSGILNNNVNGISSYDSSYKNKGISTFSSTKRIMNQNNDDYVPEKVMKISYVTPLVGSSKYVFGNGLAVPNNNNNAYPAARQQQHIIISSSSSSASNKTDSPPSSSSSGTTIKMKRLAPMVNGISVVSNGVSSANADQSSYSSFDQQVFTNTNFTVTAV